jgi:hypothetical protein
MKKLLFIAIIFLILMQSGGAMCATYTAQEVLKIHQNRFAVAHDLHVKFWQKEDNINVLSWNVLGTSGGLPMPTSAVRGLQPEPYHSRIDGWNHPTSADNGLHAVDLAWYNLNIPYCRWVDIKFRWKLTEYNTKNKQIYWSGSDEIKHAALFGWEVADGVWDGTQWRYAVTLSNLDDASASDAMPLYVSDLKWWSLADGADLDADVLENWSDWNVLANPNMTLYAGASFSFNIYSTVELGRILCSMAALVSPGADLETGGLLVDVFDHTVPEPATLFLLTTGLFVIRRRK